MSNINLHILKASGRLARYEEEITSIVDGVVEKVSKKIPLPNIDVVVYDEQYGYNIIPEIGIGGHTYSPNNIVISLNPNFPKFLDISIREELARMLTHELNHAARWQAVGYGKTLLEAMISEGLSDHFDIEINNKSPQLWDKALTKEQMLALSRKAEKEYHNKKYDHNSWFFGSKEKGIPRWTGYTLGYNLVAEYLKNNSSKKPSQTYNLKAEEFV